MMMEIFLINDLFVSLINKLKNIYKEGGEIYVNEFN